MNAVPVLHAPDPDRTRANTWAALNDAIDRQIRLQLERSTRGGSTEEIAARIHELEREWDVDRVLEAEAAVMGLLSLGLAAARADRRLIALPMVVAGMVLLHGTQGWYPLLPIFRRLGFRTRDEIDRERYALKALRGDFSAIPSEHERSAERAAAAWSAVCA